MKEFHECNFDLSLPLLLLVSNTLGLLYVLILGHLFALLLLDTHTNATFNAAKKVRKLWKLLLCVHYRLVLLGEMLLALQRIDFFMSNRLVYGLWSLSLINVHLLLILVAIIRTHDLSRLFLLVVFVVFTFLIELVILVVVTSFHCVQVFD